MKIWRRKNCAALECKIRGSYRSGRFREEGKMSILDEIAARTRERIQEEKRRIPQAALLEKIRERGLPDGGKKETYSQDRGTAGQFRFYQALKKEGMSYICEVKKASPSKGIIAPEFPWLSIAGEYEAAGASAISCLTEPYYFLGADQYLAEIADRVKIPVLRKDFTLNEYMVYQAAALGASAVLLICALLDDGRLRAYRELAESFGLDALVEAHDEEETERALKSGARIIGVNNRDLKTFQVDMDNSIRLRKMAPENVLFVSESGIRTPEDIRRLRENQVDAVLIGETLMRRPDKRKALEELNGGPLAG